MGMFENFVKSSEGFVCSVLVMLTLLSPVFLHNKFFMDYAPKIFADTFRFLSDFAPYILTLAFIIFVYRRIKSVKILIFVSIFVFLFLAWLISMMSGA